MQGPAPLAQVGLLVPGPQKMQCWVGGRKPSPANSTSVGVPSGRERSLCISGSLCSCRQSVWRESPEVPHIVFVRPKRMLGGCFVTHKRLQPCFA